MSFNVFFIAYLIVALAISACWLYTLLASIMANDLSSENKIISVLVHLLAGPIGCLVYLVLPRTSKRSRHSSRMRTRAVTRPQAYEEYDDEDLFA